MALTYEYRQSRSRTLTVLREVLLEDSQAGFN